MGSLQQSGSERENAKRNCYVTCEADERDLTPPIAEIGEDHILY